MRERRDKQHQLQAELQKTSKISTFFSTTKGAPRDTVAGGNDVAVQLSLNVASASEEDEHTTVELEHHIGAQENEPVGADEMEVLEPDSEPNSEPDSESAPDPEPSMPITPGAPGDDLGKWDREEINEQSRCFWIAKGSSTCQHLNGLFDFSMMIDGKVKRWCSILFHLLPSFQGLQWPILHRSLRLETCQEIYFPARDKRTSLGLRAMLVRSNSKGRIDSELAKQLI